MTGEKISPLSPKVDGQYQYRSTTGKDHWNDCTYAEAEKAFADGLDIRVVVEWEKSAVEGQCDTLQRRLATADELIREAWRLMDGQDPKTAQWHLAASHYINKLTVNAGADTSRLDLYERIHRQEFALVPYFDDAVAKWFIPPADDDQGDGRTFETLREALDWLAGEATADHA